MPEATQKIADLPRKRSEEFVSAYANHTEATPSFYDLRLLFCHIAQDTDGRLAVEQKCAVILAWEHVIRVRDLLDRLIEGYEQDHGKIRLQTDELSTPELLRESH